MDDRANYSPSRGIRTATVASLNKGKVIYEGKPNPTEIRTVCCGHMSTEGPLRNRATNIPPTQHKCDQKLESNWFDMTEESDFSTDRCSKGEERRVQCKLLE